MRNPWAVVLIIIFVALNEQLKTKINSIQIFKKKHKMKIFLHTLICIISINMADAQWTTANLSTTRFSLSATSVGTKVFFAGGFHNNVTPSSVVNIYDNSTSLWTIANLSVARGYLSAATVGSKVFFAGGDDGNPSSVVDIYDNSTGLWTTANLSQARSALSSTAVGTKVFFAGGMIGSSSYSSVVDIYDNSTGLWTTANLSQARSVLSATAVGTKVFFAGGFATVPQTVFSVVDIYDNSTGLWTTDSLSVARGYLSATSVGTKVFFAGGRNPGFSSVVDIYDNTIADINVINNNEGIEIYPNPAINQFTIDNDSDLILMKIESVAIYDVSGRKVYSENLGTANSNPKITIDVSKFSAGVYQVKVQSADFIATKKLVVEK